MTQDKITIWRCDTCRATGAWDGAKAPPGWFYLMLYRAEHGPSKPCHFCSEDCLRISLDSFLALTPMAEEAKLAKT